MKTIVMLVGYSASGKSETAKTFATVADCETLYFSDQGLELSKNISDIVKTRQIEKGIYNNIIDALANNKILIIDGVSSYNVYCDLLNSDVSVKVVLVFSPYFKRIQRLKNKLHISINRTIALEREKRIKKESSGLKKIMRHADYRVRNYGDFNIALKQFERIFLKIKNEERNKQ